MRRTICKATGNELEFERVVKELGKAEDGSTLVFTLGVHGNEPTGLEAFIKVCNYLEQEKIPMNGKLVGVAGNMEALEQGVRFVDSDLNRNWTDENIEAESGNSEWGERKEIYELVIGLIEEAEGCGNDFYHFDLHTTSSASKPFSIINESVKANLVAATPINATKIIGLHTFQESTMTDYWNSKGVISYLFEGGQHDSLTSVENHESFIICHLVDKGLIDRAEYEELYLRHSEILGKYISKDSVYFRVCHCHRISAEDDFEMNPGYTNLLKVEKGEVLAKDKNGEITSELDGYIFMPLYQQQGDDGFFIVCPLDTA